MDEPGRKWWQRLPVIVVVGVVPLPFGLFFLAFIAMAMLLTDQTRESETRAGGAVLLFWWAYNFREGDTSPYFASVLLAIGAALLLRGALRRWREGRRSTAWVPVAGAVGAMAFAVVAFVPDGYREPELTREAALRATLAERTENPWRRIAADSYLVERGRARFLHTPLWYVVLYEHNPEVPQTLDGERCFSRREVWEVDALDAGVSRVTYDEARVADDPCLPVRLGTREDLKPVPR